MLYNILYLNHSGNFSGSQKSLTYLLKNIKREKYNPIILTQRGPSNKEFQKLNIKQIKVLGLPQFDNTNFGYYRGWRWLILIREFFYFIIAFVGLIQVKVYTKNIHIVHFNEITISYMLAPITKYLFPNAKIIVHVRSIQNQQPKLVVKVLSRFVDKFIDHYICIDASVRNSLNLSEKNISIIHNGFELNNIKITKAKKGDQIVFGMLNNFVPNKGILEFIKAIKIFVDSGYTAKFLIAGNSIKRSAFIRILLEYFNISQDVRYHAEKLITELSLTKYIKINDFTYDINSFYNKIDVICFPSSLNAPGRPVFEAAFYKIPSIVAVSNPTSDTIIDKYTGLCIKDNSPSSIFKALKYYVENPEKIGYFGNNAYNLVKDNYTANSNAIKTMKLYNESLFKTERFK